MCPPLLSSLGLQLTECQCSVCPHGGNISQYIWQQRSIILSSHEIYVYVKNKSKAGSRIENDGNGAVLDKVLGKKVLSEEETWIKMQRKSTSDKEAANLKAVTQEGVWEVKGIEGRVKTECGVREEWERMRLKRWLGGWLQGILKDTITCWDFILSMIGNFAGVREGE